MSSISSKPFGDVVTSYQQSAMSIVLKLRDLRQNPDFFQKVGQVAAAALEYAILTVPSLAHMSRLVIVLKTVNMHDYYAILKLPRLALFPISPSAIDELAVLESLKTVIKNHRSAIVLDYVDAGNFTDEIAEQYLRSSTDESVCAIIREYMKVRDLDDAAIDAIARNALKAELASMSLLACDSYVDENEFKKSLKTLVIAKAPKQHDVSVLAGIDLTGLNVTLRPVSIIEKINNIAWVLVDLGCAASYFKEWDFIDFAKLSQSVGSWVTHVDAGLYGVLTSAFALRFIEAARKLQHTGDLTPQELRQAKWDLITSTFETTLYGLSFLRSLHVISIGAESLCLLTIVAKSLGLISIATRPEHEYFQKKIAAAAA